MVAFIDAHRKTYGVEPICRVLPIAPSTYFRRKAHAADPTRRSARAQRDDELRAIIRRIWTENRQVYGTRKVWRQMGREKIARRALPGAPPDARDGADGGDAWPRVGEDDSDGSDERPTGRPGRAAIHGDPAESAVSVGLHLCRDVARLRVCRVRH